MSKTVNAVLNPVLGRRERTIVVEVGVSSSVKLQALLDGTTDKWVDTGDNWGSSGSYDFFQGEALLKVVVTGTAEWEVY